MLVPTTPRPGNPWVGAGDRPGYDSLFDWLRGTPYDQRMAYYWNTGMFPGGNGLDISGLNQAGRFPGAGASSQARVEHRRSNPALGDLLNRILDEYQRAYNEYRQAVEERYAQARQIAERTYKRNIGTDGQMGRFLALEKQLVPQWYQRSQTAIDMLQGLGEQHLKDIERQYKEKEGRLRQELTSRGLAGTTIPASVSIVTEREKQDALGRTKESLRQQFLSTYLDTTKDAMAAAERFGLQGVEMDRALSKDIIDILANRDDVPPNLSQLIDLAKLAATGLAQEEFISSVGAGGGGGGGGGGPGLGFPGVGGGMGGMFPIIGSLPGTWWFPYMFPIKQDIRHRRSPPRKKKPPEEPEEEEKPGMEPGPMPGVPPIEAIAEPVVGPGMPPGLAIQPFPGPYPVPSPSGSYPYPYPVWDPYGQWNLPFTPGQGIAHLPPGTMPPGGLLGPPTWIT